MKTPIPPIPLLIRQIPASETWTLRHKAMWPDQPPHYVKPEEDEKGLHFGLYHHSRPVPERWS